MKQIMKQVAGVAYWICLAMASSTSHAANAHAAKQKKQVAVAEKHGAGAEAPPDEEKDEPDVQGSTATEYSCELGNKVTIYENAGDDQHIALRWKKRLHRLTRVGTSTGANRFENKTFGLVWIGIPSKSMLLDSAKKRQLANECRNPQQVSPEPENTQ